MYQTITVNANDYYKDPKKYWGPLVANKRDAIIVDDGGNILAVLLRHDGEEGEGDVLVEKGGYGPIISVDGYELWMVDLFHNVEPPQECDESSYPQLVVYNRDPGDDPLGYIAYPPGKVIWHLDRFGVEMQRVKNGVGLEWVYEETEPEPDEPMELDKPSCPPTRAVELMICTLGNGDTGTWYTEYVDVPGNTPEDRIEAVAKDVWRAHNPTSEVAKVCLYSLPPLDDEINQPREDEEDE